MHQHSKTGTEHDIKGLRRLAEEIPHHLWLCLEGIAAALMLAPASASLPDNFLGQCEAHP